jgi:hypothetical protein
MRQDPWEKGIPQRFLTDEFGFCRSDGYHGPKLDARRRALRRSALLGAPSSAQAVIRKEKNA